MSLSGQRSMQLEWLVIGWQDSPSSTRTKGESGVQGENQQGYVRFCEKENEGVPYWSLTTQRLTPLRYRANLKNPTKGLTGGFT